jgi:uncharacterized membrane protein YccF (DUF307 family)
MSAVVVNPQKGPGCVAQVLWFVFIGWWLGQLWIGIAWLLILTIIGIPLAVMMLNNVPQIIALRSKAANLSVTNVGGVTIVSAREVPQHNILLRAGYFVLIGWWLSAIWMELAYFACITLIGLPIGFWMFDKTPALVSLRR